MFDNFFKTFGWMAILAVVVNLAFLAGSVYVVCLVLRHFGVIA